LLEVFEVEVEVEVTAPPPRPSPADANDVVVGEIVVELGVEEEIFEEVVRVELLTCDCAIGTELLVVELEVFVEAPVTPGLAVGNVTEFTGRAVVPARVAEVFITVDVVVLANVGHKACTIPPFITIPNNVLELTLTSEQALVTSSATEFSAATHAAEQPLLKSDAVHVGI
jgi:hypothetical protein